MNSNENKLALYAKWRQEQIERFNLDEKDETSHNKLIFNHKTTLGGTADSVLLKCSPWRTLPQLYEEIIGDFHLEQKAKMRMGILLEGEVRDTLANEILHAKVVDKDLFLSPDEGRPWSSCQVDSVIEYQGKTIPCEIKTTGRRGKDWGKGSEIDSLGNIVKEGNQIPIYYYVQCQKQLWATGKEFMFLFCRELAWCIDSVYVIKRDDEIIDAILKAEDDFMFNNLIPRVPPVEEKKEEIEAVVNEGAYTSDDIVRDCELLAELNKQYDELSEQISIVKAHILEEAKGYKSITNKNGEVLATISSVKGRSTFDSKTFKKDNPELYKKYVKENDSVSYRLNLSKNILGE